MVMTLRKQETAISIQYKEWLVSVKSPETILWILNMFLVMHKTYVQYKKNFTYALAIYQYVYGYVIPVTDIPK